MLASLPDPVAGSEANYMVQEPWGDIQQQVLWWTIGDEEENSFLGLPYFPFISNCKGADNNIAISKVSEDNPSCILIDFENTVSVDENFWNSQMEPTSDQCFLEMECSYEEQIDIPLTGYRWYELGAGVPLWWITYQALPPEEYEPVFETALDGTKTYITR